MKLTINKNDISPALAFCKTIVRTGENPILSNCLIRASDNRITVASHAIYSSKQSTIPAKIFEPGITTLPLEALYQIVNGAPKDTAINIVVRERATISFGRSRYSLGTLPADLFPPLLTAEKTNPLPLDERSRQALFNRPAQLCLQDEAILLYAGVWLHERDGLVASIGSDGTRMLSPTVDQSWGTRTHAMVPRQAALEIAKMSADAIFWDKRCITAKIGNNLFSARLLDVGYGDYGRIIPPTTAPALEFNRVELLTAMQRLASLANHGSIIRLKWAANPKTALLEFVSNSDGSEIVACSGKIDAGVLGLPPIRCSELIESLRGETMLIHVSEPMRPLRFYAPAEPNTLAMQSPCRAS